MQHLSHEKYNLQVRLTEDKSAVEMSKILMWYRSDFGSDDAAVITAVAGQVFERDLSEFYHTKSANAKPV